MPASAVVPNISPAARLGFCIPADANEAGKAESKQASKGSGKTFNLPGIFIAQSFPLSWLLGATLSFLPSIPCLLYGATYIHPAFLIPLIIISSSELITVAVLGLDDVNDNDVKSENFSPSLPTLLHPAKVIYLNECEADESIIHVWSDIKSCFLTATTHETMRLYIIPVMTKDE